MSKKLTITVPDELHVRLQKVRDKLKVSKICQQSLEDTVIIEEMKSSSSVEVLVERLKKEKAQYYKDYRDMGFNDGKNDAMSFTYSSFMMFIDYVGSNCDNKEGIGYLLEGNYLFSDTTCDKSNFFHQGGTLPTEDFSTIYQDNEDRMPEAPHFYEDGWIEGVFFMWSLIKEKM